MAKCTQHVVPNNVAICCVEMLWSFGRILRAVGFSYTKRERKHCKQLSAFPSSMHEFVTPQVIHLMSISFVNLFFAWSVCSKECKFLTKSTDKRTIHTPKANMADHSRGRSLMKARLDRHGCFVLTMPHQKNVASSSIWFVLFHYDMLCFWTLQERI